LQRSLTVALRKQDPEEAASHVRYRIFCTHFFDVAKKTSSEQNSIWYPYTSGSEKPSKNFDIFKNKFQDNNIKILDIYKIFNSNDKRFYESGDTHWNDFGVKKVFSEIIKISHNVKELQLQESGIKKENNLVLKRLGLVDKTVFQNQYKINFESNENKKLLIIHDSFFEKFYVSEEFLNQYFDSEFLNWSVFQNMSKSDANNLLKEYELVIIESSIDTFFEERVLVFSK